MRMKWVTKYALQITAIVAISFVTGSPAQESTNPAVGATPALITRDRFSLSLAGAELIVAATKAKAKELKVNENIAVVDDGGHLLAFARMDKARPASISTALTKAVAAATTRQATGPNRRGDSEPDLLLNLSLQNAAATSGGKMTSLLGGVPIIVEGQVVGAVGVGGGTGEQDAEVAKAGIDQLLKEAHSMSER